MGCIVQWGIPYWSQVDTKLSAYDFPQSHGVLDMDNDGIKVKITGLLRGGIVCPHTEIFIPHTAVAASIEKWMRIYDSRNPLILDARTT